MVKKGKKGKKAKRPNHVGAMAGILGFGMNVFLDPEKDPRTGSTASAVHWLIREPTMAIPERINRAKVVVIANLKEPETYIPLAVGAMASASKKIPLVRMVATPVDSAIAKFTHGRWRL